MSDEVKKISFGFSKLAKPKTSIISNSKTVKSDDSVQFIDCVEDKSIKVINEGPKKPDFLVIPLPKQPIDSKRRELLQKILNNVNDSDEKNNESDTPSAEVSTISENNKLESLDERAAREIIEDLKKDKSKESETNSFTVPLSSESANDGKEATLDDYDNIPIDKFGMAMLRGMGWAPGKGIGKTEQVVSAKQPLLRPKGLGLGADKVIKTDEKSSSVNESLKLIKGSFVRIIAGIHKDLFGEVIGFDDETGRLIVKTALGNNVLTFNEFMVEVISKDNFNKNSKVINVKKYEEYKKMENSQDVSVKRDVSKETSDHDDHRLSYKTDRKSNESSIDSSEERRHHSRLEVKEKQSKEITKNTRGKADYKSSPVSSPERYRSKDKYSNESFKRSRTDHSNSSELKKDSKYQTHYKSKSYRSSSEESIKTSKHIPRKESKRSKSSSSSDSSTERHSKRKESKSKNHNRNHSSSSDASSDEDRREKYKSRTDYKKKCKKNKEKKKSRRRRSRSSSGERKRNKSFKKHKKSRY